MDQNTILTWSAPARPAHTRDKRWYIVAGSIATLLVIYALYTQAWTFAIVIALLGVMYGILHGKNHPLHSIRITEKALYWDIKTISWDELDGFWMLQGPDYVELHIEFKQKGKERLVIQTENIPPQEIAAVLSRFIPGQTDRHEKLLDYIIRICKL